MDRHAVIDIGSSSVKYAVYAPSGGRLTLVRERDPVATGLGFGLVPGGPLHPEARRRTLETIAAFAAELEADGAALALVAATEAVRQTGERDAFLADVRAAVGPGPPVLCIPFETEARWAYRSAHATLGPFEVPTLIADPGGSSNDFAFGRGEVPEKVFSLRFGMNQLMARVDPESDAGRAPAEAWDGLREDLRRRYAALPAELAALPAPGRLIATSGAVLALAGVRLGLTDPSREVRARRTHGAVVTRSDIEAMIAVLAPLPGEERRRRHPCLSPTRAAIFVHGALLYEALLEALELDRLTVNGYGMKLGGLVETLEARPERPGPEARSEV